MKKQKFVLFCIFILTVTLPFVSCGKKKITAGPTGITTITKVKSTAEKSAVKMSHDKHSLSDVKCVVCHHKDDNDGRIKLCSKCKSHKGDNGKEILHDLCINCHNEKKAGPIECDSCHKSK